MVEKIGLAHIPGFYLKQVFFLLCTFVLSVSEVQGESLVGINLGSAADGAGLSLSLNTEGMPAFSYTNANSGHLAYAYFDGTSWLGEVVDDLLTEESDTALVFLQGQAHIFYLQNGSLLHAYLSGVSWLTEAVVSDAGVKGEVSAVPCGEDICVAYYQGKNSQLRLLRGNTGLWQTELIAAVGSGGEMHELSLDEQGGLVVAYYDEAAKVAQVAERSSEGVWTSDMVSYAGGGNVGWSPSVVIGADGVRHVSFSRVKSAATKQEVALYYGRKEVGGSWEVVVVCDDYAGGETAIRLNDENRPVILSQYLQYSDLLGDQSGVVVSELTESGWWEFSGLMAKHGRGALYQYSALNLGISLGGGLLVAYHFLPDAEQEISRYALHANENETFMVGGDYFYPPKPEPRLDKDSDSDGLYDSEEAAWGTDPKNPDSDGDGILDGAEVLDGTNPLDSGSYYEALGSTICGEWNSFLGGMWNIFEHVNMTEGALGISSVLSDMWGADKQHLSFSIDPNAQRDVLVHDLESHQSESYGQICSTHKGSAGSLDGRMVYYKPNLEGSGFQFAFAMPMSNGMKGEQWLSYNTYYPSMNPEDATNLAANWIQVMNLGESQAEGTLTFFDQEGQEQGSTTLVLAGGARKDVPGHQFGENLVGLVRWSPHSNENRFQIRNVRYLYDNPGSINSFDTAFQIEGAVGIGDTVSAAVSTIDQELSVVEIGNTDAQSVLVTLSLYDSAGEEEQKIQHVLAPRAVRHIIVNELLGQERRGSVSVSANRPGSISTVVMQYAYESNGSVAHMYGVAAKPAIGSVLRGSYNTYLNQESELVLVNSSNSTQTVALSLVRNDGTSVSLRSGSSETLSIPPHGLHTQALSDLVGRDDYGVITLRPALRGTIVGTVLRKRDDYVMPTPVRP